MSSEIAKPSVTLTDLMPSSKRLATSMDMTKPQNRKMLLSCLNDCDKRLTEEVNMPIKVVNYLAHDVELTNKETGEVSTALRLVLIDADGKTHECVSATLVNSLAAVIYAYDPPPWVKPLTLVVKKKQSGQRQVYWFDVQ